MINQEFIAEIKKSAKKYGVKLIIEESNCTLSVSELSDNLKGCRNMLRNVKQSPEFYKLKDKIEKADTPSKLELLRKAVKKFHKNNVDNKGELLTLFILKEQVLNP